MQNVVWLGGGRQCVVVKGRDVVAIWHRVGSLRGNRVLLGGDAAVTQFSARFMYRQNQRL